MKVPSRSNLNVAKFPMMDNELVGKIRGCGKPKARVSSLFILTKLKLPMEDFYPDTASIGSKG